MESSEFKLQERTALLTGPCTSVMQAVATTLTQLGCSVALADSGAAKNPGEVSESHRRLAERLMDAREVHERYGHATAINADFTGAKGVKDVISRAAQAFGGIDIYIDGLMTFDQFGFRDEGSLEDIDRIIGSGMRAPLMMTQSVLPFLEGRKRGRVIYLIHDLMRLGLRGQSISASARGGLTYFARSLARETVGNKVTVNCVAVGATEELLLAYAKNIGSQQLSIQAAHAELLKKYPDALLTEPDKVASTVAFLASSLGSGITGQTIAVSQGLSLL